MNVNTHQIKGKIYIKRIRSSKYTDTNILHSETHTNRKNENLFIWKIAVKKLLILRGNILKYLNQNFYSRERPTKIYINKNRKKI